MDFSSLDSLEGVVALPPAPDMPVGRRLLTRARAIAPGVVIALLVALAASWLSDHYGAPVMLFALLLGMAVNFLSKDARCRPGIDFSSRTILRIGVALLGARITLGQIESLGLPVLLLTMVGVATTIASGLVIARLLKLKPDFGVLTGGAVAICGASAALAISAALPRTETRDRDTILTVVAVTTLSTIAMVIYPILTQLLHLSNHEAGIFLGATIHDVAQVVGAGYSISHETGDTATIVKLFRVALLLPSVMVVLVMFRSAEGPAGTKRPPIVPFFLLGFVALVLLNSWGHVPTEVLNGLGEGSRWALVIAIAALGTKTSLGELVYVGWRPILLIVGETVFVAILVGVAILARLVS